MAKKVLLKELSKVSSEYKKEEYKDITDSVKYWSDNNADAMEILFRAQRCYDDMRDLREMYQRCKEYTYSDQWNDKIEVEEDGKMVTMTEKQYMQKQGIVPLTNNLIRRTVRNIVGVYRNQDKEKTCATRDRAEQQYGEVLSTLLQYNRQANNMKLKDARSIEVAIIGGFSAYKHTVGWKNHKFDCWTDQVSVNRIFCDNNVRSYDGDDFSLIGEIHDIPFQDVCSSFARSNDDIRKLKAEYTTRPQEFYQEYLNNQYRRFGQKDENISYEFFVPENPNLCRVIEVWTKETRNRYHCWDVAKGEYFDIDEKDYDLLVTAENAARIAEGVAHGMEPQNVALVVCDKHDDWFIDEYWYYRYITPYGHILQEGETPYEHGEHPYTVFMYPFIDGEIHSYVHDIIPQQKLINRNVTMQDWIMRCSAKGVLLYPEGAFDNQDPEEVAKLWSSPNGILSYKAKPGVPMPQQISANSTNIGIAEQLNTQIAMFEDESGINGALQGKPGYSTTSGTLYAQQTANATNSLIDILESHSSFEIQSAYKTLKNILQFYDDDRILQIAGDTGLNVSGNADHIRNVEFDISIIESTSSPTYRAIANDYLIQFWQAGQITMEQLLTYGNFPFADGLLQGMKAQQAEAMAQGQMPPEQQQQSMPYMTKDSMDKMQSVGEGEGA